MAASPAALADATAHSSAQPLAPPSPQRGAPPHSAATRGAAEAADWLSSGALAELQVRTAAMDAAAEAGDASHASYKGGLDARQARQLRDWTQALRVRLEARR
eukprot:4543-Chlamydomonas_euryale.AAC.1